ncbi:MaoC family dehydratase [Limnohabitans sp. Rim8]|uniref:MaoC family dehydratase n=1 Tax=Limnohabitans sp. Rim8 TaxID=1100718 RepID=UPI002612B413|nr:MaoC family dehydratase [Limnohabitans sp. Rim8]
MTSLKPWADVKVGDIIPVLALPPVSRLNLALYCGASGDHNPIHVDIDFVRTTGLPDVIAHGMLSMAWLGRLLTNWVPQTAIREYSVRFAAMTQIGEFMTCTGEVTDKFQHAGEQRVRLSLTTANAEGQVKLSGEAVIALA